jgi:hypothetical protein
MTKSDETVRYREAAHRALDQLDWCVEYLRSIHKTQISKQIAKNRSTIARTLAQRDDDRHART